MHIESHPFGELTFQIRAELLDNGLSLILFDRHHAAFMVFDNDISLNLYFVYSRLVHVL